MIQMVKVWAKPVTFFHKSIISVHKLILSVLTKLQCLNQRPEAWEEPISWRTGKWSGVFAFPVVLYARCCVEMTDRCGANRWDRSLRLAHGHSRQRYQYSMSFKRWNSDVLLVFSYSGAGGVILWEGSVELRIVYLRLPHFSCVFINIYISFINELPFG